MHRNLLIFTLLLSYGSYAQLRVSGIYRGQNLYVSNPMNDEGFGYCTDSIKINGEKYDNEELSKGAYEIPLDSLGFQSGDSLYIVIYHQPNCKPKILNNRHPLLKRPAFENAEIESDKITWALKKAENGRFWIETYRWNKWVKLGEVESFNSQTDYEFSLQDSLHTGVNQVRVTFLESSSDYRVTSETMTYDLQRTPVSFDLNKKTLMVTFSEKTSFELYNAHGDILQRGFAKTIDLSSRKKGVYYLNFDNENGKIRVKK